jgi:uncharacterized protein
VNDPAPLPPLLHGLFRELVANGMPIGIRDYLDGIRALRLGYGQRAAVLPGDDGMRQALCALARTLWARSDEEHRLISRWFARIPAPPGALVNEIDAALDVPGLEDRRPDTPTTPAPGSPDTRGARKHASGEGEDETGAIDDRAEQSAPRARVRFERAQEGGGLPVPRLEVAPVMGEEYVLNPQTLVSLRELVVLWRRYRRSTRRGPRTELDVAATVGERCRRGLLLKPVCRPRRSNSARLLVLADVSPSMDPWRPFVATLADSLHFGRLHYELFYFANQPRKQLFASADLRSPQDRDEVLRRHAGAGLLIVSDAGSARGSLNRRRATQTLDFLAGAIACCPSAVWLNPMPRTRWAGTTAARIAADTRVPMLPLDGPQLLRAVDILRGNK